MFSEARLDVIIEALHQGKSVAEIDRMLAWSQRKGRVEAEMGRASEIKVRDLISGLPFVSAVEQSEEFGKRDRRGVDLLVVLNSESGRTLAVKVQVKSSLARVQRFRSEFAGRCGRQKGESVAEVLARERMIVLNGRWGREAILEDFERQLEAIESYHQV